MSKLNIIVGSTRPGRLGIAVANWFVERARSHGHFELELVDLAAVNLPMLDEPKHPSLREYEHVHTRAWSATVASADAFVFVTPEYNHGAPAPLVNAIDYLVHEWSYKPAAFVSYGGISGGTRSAEMTRQLLGAVKVVVIPEAVNIPFIFNTVKDGVYLGGPSPDHAAQIVLDELARWDSALRALRAA